MPDADLIITAARIRTLDERRPSAHAVAVRGGLIVALDDDALGLRGRATRTMDLGEATLTPGLVDGHLHPVIGTMTVGGLDLSGVRDVRQLRATVAEAVRATPRGGWLVGHGLNHNVFAGEQINRMVIDDVLDGVPAAFLFYDGHSVLAGDAALRAAGITGPREFASNSAVAVDAEGVPTGHLIERDAFAPLMAVIPPPDPAEHQRRLMEVLRTMAATGLTEGHVMDLEPHALELVQALERDGELPVRLRFAADVNPGTADADIDRLLQIRHSAGRRWSVGGAKLFIDGSVEGGSAWLESPDCCGANKRSFWRDPADYTRAVARLAESGVPTATHAIGDAGVRHVLDSLRGVPGTARHRIEHIETLGDDQIPRFAAQGVIASMQPAHATYTRADHTDAWSTRLGEARAGRAWRCRDIVESGAVLVLGSDWPVAPLDARLTLATAQLRRLPGTTAPPVRAEQGLTALQSLQGMTMAPAFAAGLEGSAGRIAPGCRADLTAFTLDPLVAPPDELAEAPIRATITAGTLVHSS
ncbi:amidohydrolase [Spirillospora sp. NPDC050679]